MSAQVHARELTLDEPVRLPRPFLEALAALVRAQRLFDEAIAYDMPRSTLKLREADCLKARAALGDQAHDLFLAGDEPILTDEDLEVARGIQ